MDGISASNAESRQLDPGCASFCLCSHLRPRRSSQSTTRLSAGGFDQIKVVELTGKWRAVSLANYYWFELYSKNLVGSMAVGSFAHMTLPLLWNQLYIGLIEVDEHLGASWCVSALQVAPPSPQRSSLGPHRGNKF